MVGYLSHYIDTTLIILHDPGKILTPQLEMFHIYFDTATFDLIEKDKMNTIEKQLSEIGGTMGLFTGFSILSAVEIIYFSVKYFMSHRNKKIVLAKKDQIEKIFVNGWET